MPTVQVTEGVGSHALCRKMRRYGPTVYVREELRLDCFYTVHGWSLR